MTEYATDPEAIQDFLNSRDRTSNWVGIHSQGLSFMSPSSPPSILSDDDALSYGPSMSDVSSTHSLPPRMLLRYEDGRPDVPISHDHSPTRHSNRGSSSQPTRSRSGSLVPPIDILHPHVPSRHAQSLSYASGSRYTPSQAQHLNTPPRSPENIRILPSRQAEESQRVPGASNSSRRSRVPSVQTVFPSQHPSIHDRISPLADPSHRSVIAPTPRHAGSSAQPIPVIASPPNLSPITHSATGSHSSGSRFYEQPGMAASGVQSGLSYNYAPPPIVYAPSGRHGRSNYQPPAIVYSPSSHGHRRAPAPGIAYSRSDPLPHPTHYSPQTSAGHSSFTSGHGPGSHSSRPRAQSTTAHERHQSRSRASSSARTRTRVRTPTPPLSDSDTSSDTSGSTYYVLPSPGQKVQIVVPNSASVYTSTAKTPRSPSSSGSPKKPFLQRLFSRGSGSVDSRGSSGQARGERGRIPVPWR